MPPSPADQGRLHVLRLCSVYEPETAGRPAAAASAGSSRHMALDGVLDSGAARFDPIGGMQNHTASLTRCLDGQGHRQTVVTSRLAAPSGVSPVGRDARVLRTGLPIRRLRQLWALAALPTVWRRGDLPLHVVHAHQGEDLATLPLGLLAARRHGCPLVVTLHCSVGHTLTGRSPRARLLRSLGGWLETRALRRADAVVALTERSAAAVRAAGVPADRVHTIPSGFDPALFHPALSDQALSDQALSDHRRADVLAAVPRPRIGYVGRLAPQKRADVLVEAFGRMREEASLVIVGDGPDRARVTRLVHGSPARERIALTGFVAHTAVPAVLTSLDVLVLPSAYEEMGSILTEAMAAGLPVVASDVGGIPEVVTDGVTGLLVPPLDVDALAGALDRLVADPALRERLAAGARRRADAYAWPRLAARVSSVYSEVREGNTRGRPTACG